MTLRELINSVDSELYSDNALYQMLRDKTRIWCQQAYFKSKSDELCLFIALLPLYTRRGSNPGHPD